jgi:hypothetical protein
MSRDKTSGDIKYGDNTSWNKTSKDKTSRGTKRPEGQNVHRKKRPEGQNVLGDKMSGDKTSFSDILNVLIKN